MKSAKERVWNTLMLYSRILSVFICVPLWFLPSAEAQGVKPKAEAAPTYASLRPILKTRCVVCHNQAALNNPVLSGGLALDTYAALRKGVPGKSGARPIYFAGKSAESELIRRLQATSPTRMMPKGGPPLPPEQIALFAKWIDAGAPAGKPESAEAAPASPSARPMPANPGAQDVRLKTLLKPTPDLLQKDTPKDALLSFALKIGPLPPVAALAYSPDGKRLAVGGYRAVALWDTTTGKPIACLTHLAGAVLGLAFRPDGTRLAVAGGMTGASGEVRVYDTTTLKPVGAVMGGHTDAVFSVAWNADGTRLATASQDKTARLWEWPSGKELRVFKDHSEAVMRVCFAPDGKSLYTASQDRNIRRFDTTSGAVLRAFSGHEQPVSALALSPDGKFLVSAGGESRLRWWNTEDGNTPRYSDGHGGAVNEIVFSKDGKSLASASADTTVRLWDAGNGGQQRALEGSTDWLYAAAISPDGKFSAGAGSEGVTRIWETANGRLRLLLLFWPPAEKSAESEWAALTPEGYYDASPAWSKRLSLFLAGKPMASPRLAEFAKTLHRPENVLKSWQGTDLEAAKLPEPPAKPKEEPAKKPGA